MAFIIRTICLSLAVCLGGCALPHQQFACGSGEFYFTGDRDSHPAIVSPQGYRHC